MFELIKPETLWAFGLLAVVSQVLVVVLWSRSSYRSRFPSVVPTRQAKPAKKTLILRTASSVLGRLGLQLFALITTIMVIFLIMNKSGGYVNSWCDLAGLKGCKRVTVLTAPTAQAPAAPDAAPPVLSEPRLETLVVESKLLAKNDETRVWLPPGYDPKRPEPYPVMVYLPGHPATPSNNIESFKWKEVLKEQVLSKKVKPFVGVFPPLLLVSGLDSQCTNIPNGLQAETWFNQDMRNKVVETYNVRPYAKKWNMVGWSTGGLCALKLGLSNPQEWNSIAVFGANTIPYSDEGTGDLYGGSADLKNQNNPLWLYQKYGSRGVRFFLMAYNGDEPVGAETRKFQDAAKGDANVQILFFGENGGHNYMNYIPCISASVDWMASGGAFN